jgi:hypothetical protein
MNLDCGLYYLVVHVFDLVQFQLVVEHELLFSHLAGIVLNDLLWQLLDNLRFCSSENEWQNSSVKVL